MPENVESTRNVIDELSILDYYRIVRKHRMLIFVVFCVIVSGSIILGFFEDPVFEATAVVIISGEQEQGQPVYSAYQSVREAVNPRMLPMASSEELMHFYIALLESRRFEIKAARGVEKKLHPEKEIEALERDYAIPEYLKTKLVVKTNEPRIIRLTAQSGEPEIATLLANEYMEVLRQYLENNVLSAVSKKRVFIEDRLVDAKEDLRLAENAGKDFLEEHRVISDPESELSTNLTIYSDLRTELVLSRVRLAAQVSRRDAIIEIALDDENNPTVVSPDVYLRDLAIVHLRNMLVEKDVELTRARQLYYPDNPRVAVIEEDLNSLREKFKEEIRSYNETEVLSQDINILSMNTKVSDLQNFVSQYEYRFEKFPALAKEYHKLFRDIDKKMELVSYLLSEFEAAKIEEARLKPSIEILDSAQVPVNSSHPRMKVRVLISAALALCLGICLAFFLDYVDRERMREKLS